ncbi:hypothetical protein ACO0LG_09180 [Undibacterium sp. Ji42W]|uniref:hypothetical protein n=1 Tax=Undibacterium sp. Ji42W TaxID=3413039 RepID=UPI003BF04850
MNVNGLFRDRVSVLKKIDGSCISDIPASVSTDLIQIMQTISLIDTGDLIVNTTSNGDEETFEVLDPGYQEELAAIPAGYRLKVKKLNVLEARSAVSKINSNFQFIGNDMSVNNHSLDNCLSRAYKRSDVSNKFAELRRSVEESPINANEKLEAMELIEVAEAQFATAKPKRFALRALLSALPQAANVATTAGAILSMAD